MAAKGDLRPRREHRRLESYATAGKLKNCHNLGGRANASKRKAMSYARMIEKEKIFADEVPVLLAEAQRIDKAEDVQFGKNRRGDELPEELRRRETPLAKISEAKAALEAEAAQAACEHAEARAKDRGDDNDTAVGKGAAAAQAAVPEPKAQRNFTDPDPRSCTPATRPFTSASTPKPWSIPIITSSWPPTWAPTPPTWAPCSR